LRRSRVIKHLEHLNIISTTKITIPDNLNKLWNPKTGSQIFDDKTPKYHKVYMWPFKIDFE